MALFSLHLTFYDSCDHVMQRAASSKETLENLQNVSAMFSGNSKQCACLFTLKELDRLSRERQSSQQCERTLIGLLLVVFLIGYPLGCALGYLFLVHWGSTTGQQLLFALGAICFPIMYDRYLFYTRM